MRQFLDINDSNTTITEGRLYELTWWGLGWWDNALKAELYYPEDANYPDANLVEVTSLVQDLGQPGATPWDFFPGELKWVAAPGHAGLGKKLGIRFTGVTGNSGNYIFFDDIHLTWDYATNAFSPNPDGGAVRVSTDANLIWSPGLWAKDVNGHDVYFGSTWAEVNSATTASNEFQITQSPNEWDPTPGSNVLTLGETYYWRIDEVNENYTPGPVPVPPNGKWKGEVWSFTVQGKARNPDPADDDEDVAKNVILHWTRGTQSLYHDIYLGSTSAEVTTATTDSNEYRDRTNLGTELYDAGANHSLLVGEDYFWRIDEVNYMTVKGDVWKFTIADYLIVDDFDTYINHTEIRAVWKDSLVGLAGDGETWLNLDPNYVVDGNSMLFKYWNTKSPYYSETTRTYATAQDWSYATNKVTELEIDFFGDVNNAPDPPMYVKLSDGSTTVQVNPGPNSVTNESVQTWHIPLSDFSGVTLSSITKITLGVGDLKGEGGPPAENGTLYFDDIRLYPPRCNAAYNSAVDFTGDCVVDNNDLNVMATDWLLTDANVPTAPQDADLINFTDPNWITGHIGSGALEFDGNDDYVYVNSPTLTGLTHMTISAWIKLDGTQPGYVGVVSSRTAETPTPSGGAGSELSLGKNSDSVGYCWNEISATWQFTSGLSVPDANWTFVAMVVDPTGCSLYAKVDGEAMQTPARHTIDLPPLEQFDNWCTIGWSAMQERYIKGAMDDVRIYDTNLSYADINDLAFQTAEPCDAPVYWYKLDETSGLVADDSGTPVLVYVPVQSKANLTDPEQKLQRYVNLRDYAILARNWLGEFMWPPSP
jgi:hypothetical protein